MDARRYWNTLTMQTVYRDFIKSSHLRKRKVHSIGIYTGVLKRVFEEIFLEIVYNGYAFTFGKLGTFNLIKYIPKITITDSGRIITNKHVNVKATIEASKLAGKSVRVYYDNEHTNGYDYKIYWNLFSSTLRNRYFYKFYLTRPMKAVLHTAIMDGTANALEIDLNLKKFYKYNNNIN